MYSTLVAFLFSASVVTIAEMSNKAKVLAMVFATKYKASKVLISVFLATTLKHALAVTEDNLLLSIHC